VVICKGPDGCFAFLHPLPRPDQYAALLSTLDSELASRRADEVTLISYGPRDTAVPVLRAVHDTFSDLLTVRQTLLVFNDQSSPVVIADADADDRLV